MTLVLQYGKCLFLAGLLVVLQRKTSADPINYTYTAIDIGTLGGDYTQASGINDSGQVTGASSAGDYGNADAFVYTPGIGMTNLGTLTGSPNSESVGEAINDHGQVTGYSDAPGDTIHAFVYTPGSGLVDIGTLGGSLSTGTGINASGQVTGSASLPGDALTHAFLYTPGSGMKDLDTLGGPFSYGAGINDSGQITGSADPAGPIPQVIQDSHAFLYSGGKMIDLGVLGGKFSYGVAINNRGQITGDSSTGTYPSISAILYTPGGGMIALPGLDDGDCLGEGINNSAQVVGFCSLSGDIGNAFLYSNGSTYNLNSLVTSGLEPGVYLEEAVGINDNGWIIANAQSEDFGNDRAYLLVPNPVPEPASVALLILGAALVAGLTWVARRPLTYRSAALCGGSGTSMEDRQNEGTVN